MNRRRFLRAGAGALGILHVTGGSVGALPTDADPGEAAATQPRSAPAGLIIRERQPVNLESSFAAIDGPMTPTQAFYVRNHFAMPQQNLATWRLRVEGEVERRLELSYDDVLKLPSRTQIVTLECAGNGRVYLAPKAGGVQWQLGAVGTAEWTGVPLAALLDRAGIASQAVEVLLEGDDEGEPSNEPRPAGKIHFARSLPLAKAREDVLLAYRMNGEQLTPAHGFPLRAVVPGWYGMASVKWLSRIVVTDRPLNGYYQSTDYAYWRREAGLPAIRTPIAEMRVKAQIARPALGEPVHAGSLCRIFGAAWTGPDAEVARVAVSTDGGKTSQEARLLGEAIRGVWRLWEYAWRVPAQPGLAVLSARATDSKGRQQPLEHQRDSGGYMIHHVLPVDVEIR